MARTRHTTGAKAKKSSRAIEAEASSPLSKYPTPVPSSRGKEGDVKKQDMSTDRIEKKIDKNDKKSDKKDTPKKKRKLKLPVTELDILKANNTGALVSFINALVGSQDDVFMEYKNAHESAFERENDLILSLSQQVEQQQKTIAVLTAEIDRMKQNNQPTETPLKRQNIDLSYTAPAPTFESPIRKKRDKLALVTESQLGQELKTIGIILDMLELLTGLRIVNYEEDDEKLHFDVKQSSTVSDDKNEPPVSAEYRLVINKKFEKSAEVNYIPTFMDFQDEDSDDDDSDDDDEDSVRRRNTKQLLKVLPDYFCDSLTFPYSTLSQFYTKINKALNKATKA